MATVGWFGYGGGSWQAEQLREDLILEGIPLRTCHEYANADVRYDPDTIAQFIDSVDIVILPSRYRVEPCKSANRLAMAWSRRKAVIVSPLPAYLEHVDPETDALVAFDKPSFLRAILRLVKDPQLRATLGNNGYKKALERFHPRDLSRRLFDELIEVGAWSKPHPETLVQVIIPHYSDNLDLVANAAASALISEGPRRDVLVVSSSKVDPTSRMRDGIRVIHSKTRLSFSEANNLGVDNAIANYTHLLLLNDDTILGSKALGQMVSTLGRRKAILNPYSNCDRGWLHDDALSVNGFELVPGMKPESLYGLEEQVRTMDEGLSSAPLEPTKFAAFYCTLIPRTVWEAVGELSTTFSNGGEDADYCYRARRLGYESYWTRGAWCYHYGGATRKFAESQDYESHQAEDQANNHRLHVRWPEGKKRIAIYTGSAWEKWHLDSYKEGGIGGSETCAARLAMVAREEGHHVQMFGEHDRSLQHGVEMYPWSDFNPHQEYWDLFISSRSLDPITPFLRAGKILVWVHDIWLLGGQHLHDLMSDPRAHRVESFVCLSEWHRDFFHKHHGVPLSKISIIPNGVNVELFQPFDRDAKVKGKLIYSSSPDRGLDNLLYCLPWIKEKVPELHLDVFYGFYNWKEAAKARNNAAELKQIDDLETQINQLDYVNLKGRVSQTELAKEWSKAYVWAYPTTFSETFCLTAKEAQLSGTPSVTSNIAALETTVGEYGIQFSDHPYSKEGRDRLISEVVRLHQDSAHWESWSQKALEGAQGISWNERWVEYWSRWL